MRSKLGLFVAVIAIALAGAAIPSTAGAATPSYQLTVSESDSTMTYGQSAPSFRAALTPPSDDPPLGANTLFDFKVGSTTVAGSLSYSAPTYSLFANGLNPTALVPGQYSVIAEYQSPNHGLLTSAPITLNVDKGTPDLQCSISNFANTY